MNLDEISKELATRYVLKAMDSSAKLKDKHRAHLGHPVRFYQGIDSTDAEKADARKIQKKIHSRATGQDRAMRRIIEDDQLAELSNYTLRNYMRKGIDQIRAKKGDRSFKRKSDSRDNYIDKAAGKVSSRAKGAYAGMDEDYFDEMSYERLKSYANKAHDSRRKAMNIGDDETVGKRTVGLDMAVRKGKRLRAQPRYEDIVAYRDEKEQLNELSPETMRSYVKKSDFQADRLQRRADQRREWDAADWRIADRRNKWADHAEKKLKKLGEEAEVTSKSHLNELSEPSTIGYFSRASVDRGNAEKRGDANRLRKRDKGLDRAYTRLMKDSPKHKDPNFKK